MTSAIVATALSNSNSGRSAVMDTAVTVETQSLAQMWDEIMNDPALYCQVNFTSLHPYSSIEGDLRRSDCKLRVLFLLSR